MFVNWSKVRSCLDMPCNTKHWNRQGLWFRRNIGKYLYHRVCVPLKKLDYKLHGKKYIIFEDMYLY